MTFAWLWLTVVFVVRTLFRRDPVAFGLYCCRLAHNVVSSRLPAAAKRNWADEALGHLEIEVWDRLKEGESKDGIGAALVWHSASILVYGWAERAYFRSAVENGEKSAPETGTEMRLTKQPTARRSMPVGVQEDMPSAVAIMKANLAMLDAPMSAMMANLAALRMPAELMKANLAALRMPAELMKANLATLAVPMAAMKANAAMIAAADSMAVHGEAVWQVLRLAQWGNLPGGQD